MGSCPQIRCRVGKVCVCCSLREAHLAFMVTGVSWALRLGSCWGYSGPASFRLRSPSASGLWVRPPGSRASTVSPGCPARSHLEPAPNSRPRLAWPWVGLGSAGSRPWAFPGSSFVALLCPTLSAPALPTCLIGTAVGGQGTRGAGGSAVSQLLLPLWRVGQDRLLAPAHWFNPFFTSVTSQAAHSRVRPETLVFCFSVLLCQGS